MSDQFKDAMSAWISLKKQIATVRADIKVLTTQEKSLRTFIQGFMKEQQITTCNVSDENAKVKLNTRKVKAPFTRDLVRKALLKYFRGDESLVQHVFDLIDEEKEVTERESISLKV